MPVTVLPGTGQTFQPLQDLGQSLLNFFLQREQLEQQERMQKLQEKEIKNKQAAQEAEQTAAVATLQGLQAAAGQTPVRTAAIGPQPQGTPRPQPQRTPQAGLQTPQAPRPQAGAPRANLPQMAQAAIGMARGPQQPQQGAGMAQADGNIARAALASPQIRALLSAAQTAPAEQRPFLLAKAGQLAQSRVATERVISTLPEANRGKARRVFELLETRPDLPTHAMSRLLQDAFGPSEAEKLTLAKAQIDLQQAQSGMQADQVASEQLRSLGLLPGSIQHLEGAADVLVGINKKLLPEGTFSAAGGGGGGGSAPATGGGSNVRGAFSAALQQARHRRGDTEGQITKASYREAVEAVEEAGATPEQINQLPSLGNLRSGPSWKEIGTQIYQSQVRQGVAPDEAWQNTLNVAGGISRMESSAAKGAERAVKSAENAIREDTPEAAAPAAAAEPAEPTTGDKSSPASIRARGLELLQQGLSEDEIVAKMKAEGYDVE